MKSGEPQQAGDDSDFRLLNMNFTIHLRTDIECDGKFCDRAYWQ